MANIAMCFPGFLRKAFTTSYDDGVDQDIQLIEIMQKYGIKGTFNLNGNYYNQDIRTYAEGTNHRPMGKIMAYETYANSGMEVALHSYTHPHLEVMRPEQVAYEIVKDREMLEGMFGRIVRGMAYPYGTLNDSVVETLRNCGVVYSRTTAATAKFSIPTDWLRLPSTCHHNHPKAVELAEKLANETPYSKGDPWLYYLWGHSYEFEKDGNWDRIEEIFSIVGGRDDVWYATNMEIYEYVEAYRSLVFSADSSIVKNPTDVDIYFICGSKQVLVPACETVRI